MATVQNPAKDCSHGMKFFFFQILRRFGLFWQPFCPIFSFFNVSVLFNPWKRFFTFSLHQLRRQKEISCCLVTSFTQANEDKAKELHNIQMLKISYRYRLEQSFLVHRYPAFLVIFVSIYSLFLIFKKKFSVWMHLLHTSRYDVRLQILKGNEYAPAAVMAFWGSGKQPSTSEATLSLWVQIQCYHVLYISFFCVL